MKIDRASSERISILRFPLIVGVVFIHAYGTEVSLADGVVGVADPGHLVVFFRNLISQGISRIAVPLFFLLSGYFFFLDFSFSANSYGKKLNSRIKTLLIPFLFWNLITLLFLALVQYYPTTQAYVSGKNIPVAAYGAFDYMNAIFGINRYPISYQFWFIRDLIVLILLSPAIYMTLNRASGLLLLTAIMLWFIDAWPIYIPSAQAFAFFYAGAYFAHKNNSLFTLDKFGTLLITSYLCIILIDTVSKGSEINGLINRFGILIGIPTVLFISKFMITIDCVKNALLWAGGCSFFVFAVHEPLLTLIRKISYKALTPSTDVFILMLYIIIPTFVIILSLFLYVSLKSIAPKTLEVISGGR